MELHKKEPNINSKIDPKNLSQKFEFSKKEKEKILQVNLEGSQVILSTIITTLKKTRSLSRG